MAKAKSSLSSANSFKPKQRKKRPGIHAKTKTGTHKHSKNYVKAYAGQGR